MSEDPTLFGEGPYPPRGPLAVLARLAFIGAVTAVVVAVFLPTRLTPDFVRSPYLRHFAAFYVVIVCAMAALPRARLRRIGIGGFVFATLLEAPQLLAAAALDELTRRWVADLGGVVAGVAPVLVERFRRRFPRS